MQRFTTKYYCILNLLLINSSLWINSLFYAHYSRADKPRQVGASQTIWILQSTRGSSLAFWEREKISFQIACAPRISINKQNAWWKGGKAVAQLRRKGNGGERKGEEEVARGCRAMLRQTIEYAWYTNKAKALDTPGERCTQMRIGSAYARVYCRYRARISVLNRGAFISSLYFPRFSIYVIYCPPRPTQSSRRVGVPPWFCESTPNPLPPSTYTSAHAHIRICIKRACFLEPTPTRIARPRVRDILFYLRYGEPVRGSTSWSLLKGCAYVIKI